MEEDLDECSKYENIVQNIRVWKVHVDADDWHSDSVNKVTIKWERGTFRSMQTAFNEILPISIP